VRAIVRYLLSKYGGEAVTKPELVALCKKFDKNPQYFVNYAIRYGYLVRVLRGLYYVKTVEEVKLKRAVDVLKVVALALSKARVRWYYGLYTALRLIGATHEYYDMIFVLNDTVFRHRAISVAGERVRFIKVKPALFGFGVVVKDGLPCSDLEKTVLDFLYLSRYGNVTEREALSTLRLYASELDPNKLRSYLKRYPRSIALVLRGEGLL